VALLEVREVNVRFGGNHAVRDVDLDVEAGRVTGLIGPNGAGKTTTLDAITGLQDATGRLLLDGVDITGLRPHQRARRGIARTFQRLEVFGSMTALDNILTAAEIHRSWSSRGSKVDARALAQDVVDRIGIRSVADERVDSLPTGLARLVEIGRALATRPRVLLLDEPVAGLDDVESDRLADLLHDIAGDGTAVLLVEHDVALVMNVCEQINVLDFGRILAVGSADEIQQDQRVHDAYLGAG
jgi:branched-chain amino acid transport system ATP-binding protein